MKKRILSLLLTVAMCACLLPTSVDAVYFQDVSSSHWARSYIEDAVDMELFNGTSPNRFQPELAMTRAMFVTVLNRLDGGEAKSTASYTDVRSGDWYAEAVAWASENNIVSGTGGGRFSPTANVTREQIITILYRYLNATDASLADSGNASVTFQDNGSISSYAQEAVQKMQKASIINGKPGSNGGLRFDPQGQATRAEVACIMCRFIDALDYEDDWPEEEPDPEAAYEQMDEMMQSNTLKSLTSQYANASDSQKKNLAEQAISYFEQQEENGTIDYCDVDRDNGVISYEIDGCEFAYFLYSVSSEGMTDGSRSPLIDTSSQSTASSFTISPNTASNASTLVGAAASNKKALILDYYSASSSHPYAGHFHKFSQEAEDRYKTVGYTPTTIYGFTVADLKSGLDQYNLMLFNTHGALINNTPVVCLSETVTSKNRANYKTDIKDGNIIMTRDIEANANVYCVYPQFFTAHYKYLNTSWVHLDLCKGFGGNNELAKTLSSLCVNNITGFGDTVPTYFANYCFANLLDYMADQYQLKDCIDYADTASRKQYRALGDKNSNYMVCPKLQLYGKGWLKLTEVEEHYGRIRIALNPDVGTITGGTYSLYCVRSDLTEALLYDGKSFTTSAFEITGLQDAFYYRIVIKVPNYDSAEAKIMAVEYPKDTNIPITYNPPKPLDPVVTTTETEITVRDLDNKALKNASVTLYGKKNGSSTFVKLTSGTTNSSGTLTINAVDISYTTLKAEASLSGYISGSTEKSFASQGKNKRSIEVTLDTEKSLEPDDDSALPNADSDGWTHVYNSTQLTNALKANRDILLMADVSDVVGVDDSYSGVLDGNKHTITNPLGSDSIYNEYNRHAWIRYLSGTIKNTNFASVSFYSSGSRAECSLIGTVGTTGVLKRCVILSGEFTAEGTKNATAGAFTSWNDGDILSCVNKANVSAINPLDSVSDDVESSTYAGGIAGYSRSAPIVHCLNTGKITASKNVFTSRAAGICPTERYQPTTNCGNTGSISGSFAYSISDNPHGYTIYKTTSDVLLGTYITLYQSSERNILSMWSDVLN